MNYTRDGDTFTAAYDSRTAQKIVRRAYLAHQMERITFRRAAAHLKAAGQTDADIAHLVGSPPPARCVLPSAIHGPYYKTLHRHRFTITEVLQCHVAGIIHEQTMIDILSTWPYSPVETFKGVKLVDGYPLDNTQRELEAGLDTGLLSQEQFDEIHRGIKLNECLQSDCFDGECLNFVEETARSAFHASKLHKLTYHRALTALDHTDMLIADIARLVHVSVATIHANLKMAHNHPEFQNNHIAVTAREVIQARTARMINSQQMFMILTTGTWTDLAGDLATCHKYRLITTDELLLVTEHTSIPASPTFVAPISA